MGNPGLPDYRFSYTTDDEPLPMWAQLAAQVRPLTDATALPAGVDRSAIANPETEVQWAQRIAEEAGRRARASDPVAQIATQEGGETETDPGVSVGEVLVGGARDVLPGIVESGAALFGASPEDAARYANETRVGATGAVRSALGALPPGLRGLMQSEGAPEALMYETVPFSDEIAGTASAMRNRTPWIETMDQQSRRRADLSERFPGSAMAGQVAQGALTFPLFGSAPAAVGIPSVGRAALASGLRAAREGAIIGTAIGADQAEARPLATTIEAMRGNRPLASIPGQAWDFATQVAPYAATGAIGSGIVGATTGGLGAAYQRQRLAGEFGSLEGAADARIRAYDDAIASQPSADTEFLPGLSRAGMDDAQLEALTTPDAPQIGDDLVNYRSAASAIQDRPVTLRGIVDESFNNDPNVLRANAVGLEARNELRQLRQNGGIPRFSEGLDRYGIMPRGDISTTDTYRARAASVTDAAARRQGALEDAWEAAVAGGRAQPIHAGEAATRLRVLADQYAQLGPSGERAASELYDFADNMVETRGVFDRGRRIASEPREGLTIREVTHELIPEARINAMQTMDGSRRTTTEARAWREAYSLLNDVRDEAMESGLGPQGIRDYRLARDAQFIGRSVPEDGRSVRLAHRAGMMAGASVGGSIGGQLAGLPGTVLGAGTGALLGNAAGRRWVQYEPAVMAAMADPAAGSVAARARGVLGNVAERLTSPVVPLAAPETAGRVAQLLARAPESLGRYAGILSDASRRGVLDVYLHTIGRTDPQAAAEIESVVNAPEITDQDALDQHYLRQTGASDNIEDADALDEYYLNRARPTPPAERPTP